MNRSEISARVISALRAARGESEVEGREIGLATPLGRDGLAIPSLALLHTFVKLEEQLGVVFDDLAVGSARFNTVRDVVDFVIQSETHSAQLDT